MILCCSVLQRVAMCCNVLNAVGVFMNVCVEAHR